MPLPTSARVATSTIAPSGDQTGGAPRASARRCRPWRASPTGATRCAPEAVELVGSPRRRRDRRTLRTWIERIRVGATAGWIAAGPYGSRAARFPSIGPVNPPATDDTWVGLSPDPLLSDVPAAWVVRPDCGAVVTFSGTAGTTRRAVRASNGWSTRPTNRRPASSWRRWPTEIADPLARRRSGGAAASRGSGPIERGRGRRGRVGPSPRRGVRGGPVRDRRHQGDRPDLEARDLARRGELGPRARSTSSTRPVGGPSSTGPGAR